MKQFSQLNANVQSYIAKFTDETASKSTLKNFLDDLKDADFKKLVEGADGDGLLDGFLAHKLHKNLSKDDLGDLYRTKYEELADLAPAANKKVLEWLERSEKLSGFRNLMKDGRDYGSNMITALTSGKKQLLADLGTHMGKDLNGYVVFKEVELWVDQGAGQYMRADAVLVKFNSEKEVADVIILEGKISGGTAFTVRQKQGWGKVAKEGKLKIKSIKNIEGVGKIIKGDELIVKPNQVKKISDHGSPKGGFTISDVDVSSFNKPKK